MAAVRSSLELVEETFTHVVFFPYHVYCFGRKKLEERKKKKEEEGGVERKGYGVSQGDAEVDGDGESSRLLVGK